jgi:hypothetical protein
MTGSFDEQEQRAAARIEHDHPQWLILWGAHTRLYCAYPRFHAPPGTVIAARAPPNSPPACSMRKLAARAHIPRPHEPPRTISHPTLGNDNA